MSSCSLLHHSLSSSFCRVRVCRVRFCRPASSGKALYFCGLTTRIRVVNLTRRTYLYVDAMMEKRQSPAPQRGSGSDSMAIGEFGGAATLSDDNGTLLASPMYWFYELAHAALNPSRAFADATRLFFKNPANPLAHTEYGKQIAAACELYERSTRRYRRPDWGIDTTTVGAEKIPVHIKNV